MRRWVLGEFSSGEEVLEAARRLRAEGYRELDIHSPFPLEGSNEALGLPGSRLPWVALVAGLSGAAGGYGLQWFANAVDWPLDVGGRPANSVPSFIPITFETAVLVGALSIFTALMVLFGFPRVSHPLLGVEAFRSFSVDGFWLSVAAGEAEASRAAEALRAMGARRVQDVAEGSP